MKGPTSFADHFSALAAQYATWRPHYPPALFDAIAAHLPSPPLQVWEAGCGSGQATLDLARRFGRVFATDPSAAQIDAHAARQTPDHDVVLAVEPAEVCSLPDASVDLVAVGQALHWFDRERFFAECERVLRAGGVLAAWCYQDFMAPPDVAAAIGDFRDRIAPHWPPERIDVDSGYADYAWPFAPGSVIDLDMTADWTLPHLLGYLSSLSATACATRATGTDPLEHHAPAIAAAWGAAEISRSIVWPVKLIVRKSS